MERKNNSRKRLRPFLEYHANNNTFRGLRWLDKERKIFRISWRNQHNRSWDPCDGEIFKAWAMYTGRHREGDPECYPEWKTRLRTALTKLNDIEEIKSLHNTNDADDPYKVYGFLDEETVSNKKGSQQGSPFSESGYSGSPASSYQQSPASQMDFLEQSDIEQNDIGKSDGYARCVMTPNIPTVIDEVSNSSSSSVDEMMDMPPNFLQEMGTPHTAPCPEMPSDLENIDSGNLLPYDSKITEHINSIGSSLPSLESFSSMGSVDKAVWEVKVFFLDQCILTQQIEEKGARLFCGDLLHHTIIETLTGAKTVFGPLDLKQIAIPKIDEEKAIPACITDKQKQLILAIQRNMDRGLLLGGNSNEVYAQRLCKARVFAFTQDRESKRLNREDVHPTCVFDLQIFKDQLTDYLKQGGSAPSPSVLFTFGQEYKADLPDMGRMLLHAKVTHMEARKLLNDVEKKKHEYSELLISDSNSLDKLVEAFNSMTC